MSGIADRDQRVRHLAEAIVAIGSEISLDDVLQQTVDTAARLVAARWAALGVLDRTGSHLGAFHHDGIDEETRARIGHPPGGHGVLRVLLRDGRPVRVADVTKSPHFRVSSRASADAELLGVPIFVRDVVYGDLYLAQKEGGEFTEADEEIVTLLAAQTAITIERVRIHPGGRPLGSSARSAQRAHPRSSRGAGRIPRPQARRASRELIRARRVLISVPGPSGDLRVVAADGEGVASMVGYIVPSQSKGSRVFARGRSERIDSLLEIPRSIRSVPAELAA
jgi:two-component system sensor histidine kinase DevS